MNIPLDMDAVILVLCGMGAGYWLGLRTGIVLGVRRTLRHLVDLMWLDSKDASTHE